MIASATKPRLLWAALFVLLCAGPLGAQTTYTWTGGGGDDKWSTGANWGGTPPSSDLDQTLLVLSGSTQLNNTLDFNLSAKSLNFAAGAGSFVVGGSNTLTLGTGGVTVTSNNDQTFNANIALGAAQTWANNGVGTFTVGGTVDNGGFLLSIGGNILGTGPVVYNGVISGSGGLTKTGAGAGRVTLSAANTYTGVTTIETGTVRTGLLADGGSASGIGASSNAAANLVLNGGTLEYTGGTVSTNRLFTVGTSGGTIHLSGNGPVNFTNTGAIAFQGSGPRTLTLSSDISTFFTTTMAAVIGDGPGGATSLTIGGTRAWQLSGANTYTGATSITGGGTLVTGAVNTLPSLSAVTVAGTLDLGGFNQSIGSLAGTGKVKLTNADLTTGADNTSTSYSGVISGTGGVTKIGTGTWTIANGPSTYTGPTTITGGTLLLGFSGSNSLPSGTAVTIGANGTFNVGDNVQTIGSLAGSGSLLIGQGSDAGLLTTGGDNTSTVFSGPILGPGEIRKAGNGTMVLSGDRTNVSAVFTVNGGTLLVNDQSATGSGTGNSTVSVNNGGTLGGTGRIGDASALSPGAVAIGNGATLRGGDANGIGTLTIIARLNFSSGGQIGVRVTDASTPSSTQGGSTIGPIPNPTSNNFLHVPGGFNGFLFELNYIVDGTGTHFDPAKSYSYQIALVDGMDLSAVNITDPAHFSTVGFTDSFNFSITGNNAGGLFLNITPVPEPATVLVLGFAVIGLAGFSSRVRRIGNISPT